MFSCSGLSTRPAALKRRCPDTAGDPPDKENPWNLLKDLCAGLEAHQWLTRIGALVDDLCWRMAVGGPVHLVLHRCEKALRRRRVRRVVDARRVDVEHLLVETPLGGPDVPDALEELVEVVALAPSRRVLEPLVVHGEALHQVLAQTLRGPLSELRASVAADAVADGENDREAVVANRSRNFAGAFLANL